MKKKLIHWWRLLTQASGRDRLVGAVKGWQVIYADGEKSCSMAYDIACDYAEMFDGKVVRYRKGG